MEATDEILAVLRDGYKNDTLHRLALLQVKAEGSGQNNEASIIDRLVTKIGSQPLSQRENLCRMAYHLCNSLWGGSSTPDDVQDALDDFNVQQLKNKLGI